MVRDKHVSLIFDVLLFRCPTGFRQSDHILNPEQGGKITCRPSANPTQGYVEPIVQIFLNRVFALAQTDLFLPNSGFRIIRVGKR